MRSPSSKTSQTKPRASRGLGGDASELLELVRALRADGLAPTAVQVGDVGVHLGPMPTAANVTFTSQPPKSIVAEYGGAEIERLLQEEPDLVDDEEQPAVRGGS